MREPDQRDSRRPAPPSGGGPLDCLDEDHRVILSVLSAMEQEMRGASPAEMRQDFWAKVASFLDVFAGQCHHGKEERELLPTLQGQLTAEEAAPIRAITHDHAEERALAERLTGAVLAGDGQGTFDAARAYVYRLREHIERENQVVLEACRRLLRPDHLDELRLGFAEVERAALGEGGRERYLDIARQLCRRTGREPGF